MATPFHELLAQSLERVQQHSKDGIVRSKDIARIDRERLLKGEWLQAIIPGWYLFHAPFVQPGDSTVWYISFWHFTQQYLANRLGDDYCLSAEQSLDLHTANTTIPKQVIIIIIAVK